MFKTRAWTRQQCWVPALAARCFTGFLLPGVCTAACPASQAGPQGCPVQGCPRNAAGPSFSLLFLYSVLGIPSTSFKQITLFFFSPSLSIMFSVDWGDFWFVFLVNFLERCSILLLFSQILWTFFDMVHSIFNQFDHYVKAESRIDSCKAIILQLKINKLRKRMNGIDL